MLVSGRSSTLAHFQQLQLRHEVRDVKSPEQLITFAKQLPTFSSAYLNYDRAVLEPAYLMSLTFLQMVSQAIDRDTDFR